MLEPERERRALRLLEEVLELPPAQRAAAVREHTTTDAELRHRLNGLLAAAGVPLERPAGLPRASDVDRLGGATTPEPGTRIGDFELVRLLGSGGMGRVYEALQDRPRRKVALKLLRFGFDSEDARRRFRYESEVLGRLRHPGIAQVHAAGTHRRPGLPGEEELPYLALEYVEGARDVLRFAREEELDRTERLVLFLQVLDAVHHAHQKGVIHRDLKPANVLVDSEGRVKVIDFGLARSWADAGESRPETRAGVLAGTMQYMSPEQLAGGGADLDVRTDVHALGVVLYELLLERPPRDLDGRSLAEIVRLVADEEPLRPARLERDFPVDLEALLLHALEHDREHRYPSAQAFAEDVRRFLGSRPISARPPSAFHQVRLFTRRRRGVVAGAALALAGLLVAVVVSTLAAVRARRAEAAALEAGSAERASREEAEVLAAELFELNLFAFEDDISFWDRMGSGRDRLQVMETALRSLSALGADSPDPGRRFELASALAEFGMQLGVPGQLQSPAEVERGRGFIEQAVRLAGGLEPAPHVRELLVTCDFHLAQIDVARDDAAAGIVRFERCLERMPALLEAAPGQTYLGMLHAQIWGDLSRALRIENRGQDALEASAEALAIFEELSAADMDDAELRHRVADGNYLHGMALNKVGRYEDALERFVLAVEMQTELAGEAPGHALPLAKVAESRILGGRSLLELGRFEEGMAWLDEGLSVLGPMVRADPGFAQYTYLLGVAHGLRADLLGRWHDATEDTVLRRERLAAAHASFRRADELYTSLQTSAPEWTAVAADWADWRARLAEQIGVDGGE